MPQLPPIYVNNGIRKHRWCISFYRYFLGCVLVTYGKRRILNDMHVNYGIVVPLNLTSCRLWAISCL